MKKRLLTGLSVLSISFTIHAENNDILKFNPSFFAGTNIDISALSAGNQMDPGVYDVEIFVNGKFIGTHSITLKKNDDNKSIIYFNKSVIPDLDFKKDISESYLNSIGEQVDLNNQELGINVIFDSSNLSVNIIAPQVIFNNIPRGYIDPIYWQYGETAAIVNYTANYYHSENNSGHINRKYDSFFSSFNTWFNIASWQFRNYSTVIASKDYNKIDTLRTYVQRDIPKLLSIIKLGEVDAQQSVLPTMSIRGMTLSSDLRMLPDSQRNYVPDIHGIANSNAKVTVSQNGNIIYETTVAPGPFLISDLYQANHGGDFNVTIQEADGSQRTFVVPYSYLPDLMRPNQSKYSFAVGLLNDSTLKKKPLVSSLTYNRGLNNLITGLTGILMSEHYQSGLVGLAINTELGAFSVSTTYASANLGYKQTRGYNIGASYSNIINDLNTSISLATYHYSSSGFSSLQDSTRAKDSYDKDHVEYGNNSNSLNTKNRVQLSINQPLGDNGNVYISASFNDYWSKAKNDSNYQVGYTNQYNSVSYTVSASRTNNPYSGNNETQYQLSLSFPLGISGLSPRMTTSYAQSSANNSYLSTSLTGTALADRSLSYGINTNIQTQGNRANNISGNVSKNTVYGSRSANASYDKNTTQYGLSMNGSVAAHSGGVTFGQYTGDTVGIIYAEGAEGATISGNSNIKIDSRGYAIYPYLSPYRDNNISLDPRFAANDIEIKNSSRRTAPVAGSIVKLKFDTVTGEFRIFEVKYKGQNIPLGATASLDGNVLGSTGGGGILMLRENNSARIEMSWVDESNIQQACYFNIEKNTSNNSNDITKKTINCI